MENIIIIGAGGFGREVKCLIEEINMSSAKKFNILGFVDDGIEKNTLVHELRVLGNIEYLESLLEKPSLVFGLGSPTLKKAIFEKLKEFNFPVLVHPKVSTNGKNIQIGRGSLICEGTIITCDVIISEFVTINLSCTIGHDAVIGMFSSLMPAVNISGEVLIEESVFIGTGAKVINQLTIGKNTIVGAGALVSKSLPNNCTAVGMPAKPIKFHD